MRWVLLVAVAAMLGAFGYVLLLSDQRMVGSPGSRLPPEPESDELLTTRHFTVSDPAALDGNEATEIYARIKGQMADAYAAELPQLARRYASWERYNKAPYRSATHGERYVNNFANTEAKAYGSGAEMPEGAIVAKDAFTVTEDGEVYTGPLALMEKMPEGFDPEGGDWRYTEILPDGTLLGRTGGESEERVAFCKDCHSAAADDDYLFFVPPEWRAEPRAQRP